MPKSTKENVLAALEALNAATCYAEAVKLLGEEQMIVLDETPPLLDAIRQLRQKALPAGH